MTIFYWLLLAAVIATALRSRRGALMALAFSVPLVRRMPSLPLPLLNFENLLVFSVLLSFGIHHPEKGSRAEVRHLVVLGLLALFVTISVANVTWSFVPPIYPRLWNSYRNLIGYKAFMTCLSIYVLANLGVRTREDFSWVLRAAVAGVLFEAGYTAAEWLLLHPGRATGHMQEPNSLGAYLSGSLGLIAGLLLALPKWSRDRRILLGGFAAVLIAILGTLSRGAYMATLAVLAVLTGFLNRAMLALGLAVLFLSPLWVPDRVKARLQETFVAEENENWRYRDGKAAEESALIAALNERLEEDAATGEIEGTRLDSSLTARIIVWSAAVQMIGDYPFGVGFGVFPFYVHAYTDLLKYKACHNMYLKLAAESGIPSILAFLALLSLLGRDAWRASRLVDQPEMRGFGWGMLGYLIGLGLNALMVDVFFQVDVNGQFWLLSGLLARSASIAALPAAEAPPGDAASPPEEPAPPAERPLYELVR